MADPILRWAGGKRQLLDDIISRLPPRDEYNNYFEPFCGGAALFFALEPANGHLNDINDPLIHFYRHFRDNPGEIITINKQLDDQLNRCKTRTEQKDFYYTRRREFNELQNGSVSEDIRQASLFLFLNRTCFNGLYRTNSDGDFNVPMKKGPIYTSSIEERLLRGHMILQDTTITQGDFLDIEEQIGENDLVFFDPPYAREENLNQFEEYNPGGFSRDKQKQLRDMALRLDQKGAYVMITNTADAEELYHKDSDFMNDFSSVKVKGARKINSDSSQREEIGYTDLLVTNSPRFWTQKDFTSFR